MFFRDKLLRKLRVFMTLVFPSLSSKIESLPSDIPDRMIEYPFIFRELNINTGRILEVGCTSPYNILPAILADKGIDVYGIDVREFKISHPNFKFIKIDIRKTIFPDKFFDYIVAVSTIEHIGLAGRYTSEKDKHGDRLAFIEMVRILKDGGKILITVPFGKPKVVGSSHRIYGISELQHLIYGSKVEKEEYYIKEENGYWRACGVDEAEKIEGSVWGDSAIACLKLSKI